MDIAKLPKVAYLCITAIILAVLGAITYLSAIGAETTEIRQVMNILANYAGLVLGGIGAVGGTIAAQRAGQAAHQTNGGLEDRMRAVIRSERERERAGDA